MNPERESLLSYQYGIKDIMDREVWLTTKTFTNPYYIKVINPYMFIMKVCDEENSCNEYET